MYVLDVGTGEIGFYVYWRDEESGSVRMSGGAKWSYPQKQDFNKTFYKSPNGKRDFAELLLKNFKLLDSPAAAPAAPAPVASVSSGISLIPPGGAPGTTI